MRQLTQVIPTVMIHHRRNTKLTTVPVCYLLNCIKIIILPLALLAIVYKVNAVITSWLVPQYNVFPSNSNYCTLLHVSHITYSTTTTKLVDSYKQKCQHFMASKTVSQFKALFPASATPSKLLITEKFSVELKFLNVWGTRTLDDLKNLVGLFGVPGKHLHLSNVKDGCIAIIWLCSTLFINELKAAIFEVADLLQTKGLLKVFIEEELVLECYQPDQQGTATVYIGYVQ